MPDTNEGRSETYINPVYPHSFPDPFVLKFRGEYFAYCTGEAADGNVFGILRSDDLVRWSYVGSAMQPLTSKPPYYWAPEVNYDNGKFYLYYSTGNEILMEIRVAVSDRPDGGFIDAGVRLTHEEFAIDAHVFVDSDGSRYLFYATDFLEYSHIGTGTVVDRMLDWKTLEGNPRPVTRAKFDWQVYDPARKEKGGVRWYTVEGPTVLRRKGKYFEMFSGGNWQNKSYGVSFAVTDSMNFTEEWTQFSDGEKILPILRTIPGKVIGPGHNSVVRGPNNRELYCVYHRWTEAGRVLAIDRMDFAGDRLFVGGPTTTEQPMPYRARSCDGPINEAATGWTRNGSDLISSAGRQSEFTIDLLSDAFLFECWFRRTEDKNAVALSINVGDVCVEWTASESNVSLASANGASGNINLPSDFDPTVFHLLRLEADDEHVRIMIDNDGQTAEVKFGGGASGLVISADGPGMVLSAIEFTPGFEKRFDSGKLSKRLKVEGTENTSDGKMVVEPKHKGGKSRASFELPISDFDLAVNLASVAGPSVGHGVELIDEHGRSIAGVTAQPGEMKITFAGCGNVRELDLPETFVGDEIRQFRLVRKNGRLSSYLDGIFLAELPFDRDVSEAAIFGTGPITVEMIRLTAI